MFTLSALAVILRHPLSFIRNLVRTAKIVSRSFDTVLVTRDRDGLVVEMRRPLDPEGPFFPALPLVRYPGFNPHTEVLPKGHKRKSYNRALPCKILLEKDYTLPMRDGVKLYCDVYRPNTSGEGSKDEKVPIILVYAPYGKEGNSELFMNELPERLGVQKEYYSGYENFEGPDPAYWVAKGYAVVNVDARGTWNSEGNMYFWGNNDVFDGYDIVEHLAKQPWCNGKVGMAGNSWLAISQWYIASSQPPSLAAIAPWEGASDAYRDQSMRGGIPNSVMSHSVGLLCPGRGLQENQGPLTEKEENAVFNAYWEDKRAKLGRITCPAYILASYNSKFHVQGTFRAWREISSTEKWLRVHNQFEWSDWPENQDDLAKFFDFYLKGIKNDWQDTAAVRLSLLNFSPNKPDVINRPMASYPPKSMSLKTYYLDAASGKLSPSSVKSESSISYASADGKSEIGFDIIFSEYTELAGYPKLKLWMQCDEHDDMDIFVLLGKIDKNKKLMRHVNFKPKVTALKDLPLTNVVQYEGPTGCLRASHRGWLATGPSYAENVPLDAEAQVATRGEFDGTKELWHPHLRQKKLSKGEIVDVEFTTWPIGKTYEKGEGLRLRISGHDLTLIEALQLPTNKIQNKGTHILHTGGKFDSCIVLPTLQTSS